MSRDYTRTDNVPDKGEYKGSCNLTACQKPNSAEWYHHSTQKYYCGSCANRLNTDPFSKRDAERLFGHTLLTFGQPKDETAR